MLWWLPLVTASLWKAEKRITVICVASILCICYWRAGQWSACFVPAFCEALAWAEVDAWLAGSGCSLLIFLSAEGGRHALDLSSGRRPLVESTAYCVIAEFVCNVVLNILLAKYWGVLGIILATLISLFFVNFIGGA